MEQWIWLSCIGALLALDHNMVGQWLLAQPLVTGAVFGGLLGDLPSGLFLGAVVQLLWIGVLPVGAHIPSDHTITAGIAVAQTLSLVHSQQGELEPTLVLCLGLAIPAGVLSGKLDILVRQYNNRISTLIENRVGRWPLGLTINLNLAGLVPAFLCAVAIYLLWLGPVTGLIAAVIPNLPQPVLHGLTWAFWALPALACAVVFDLITKDGGWIWIIGALGVALPLFGIWPQHALAWLVGFAVLGLTLAVGRKSW